MAVFSFPYEFSYPFKGRVGTPANWSTEYATLATSTALQWRHPSGKLLTSLSLSYIAGGKKERDGVEVWLNK